MDKVYDLLEQAAKLALKEKKLFTASSIYALMGFYKMDECRNINSILTEQARQAIEKTKLSSNDFPDEL